MSTASVQACAERNGRAQDYRAEYLAGLFLCTTISRRAMRSTIDHRKMILGGLTGAHAMPHNHLSMELLTLLSDNGQLKVFYTVYVRGRL